MLLRSLRGRPAVFVSTISLNPFRNFDGTESSSFSIVAATLKGGTYPAAKSVTTMGRLNAPGAAGLFADSATGSMRGVPPILLQDLSCDLSLPCRLDHRASGPIK